MLKGCVLKVNKNKELKYTGERERNMEYEGFDCIE